jgi:hypothetical protein
MAFDVAGGTRFGSIPCVASHITHTQNCGCSACAAGGSGCLPPPPPQLPRRRTAVGDRTSAFFRLGLLANMTNKWLHSVRRLAHHTHTQLRLQRLWCWGVWLFVVCLHPRRHSCPAGGWRWNPCFLPAWFAGKYDKQGRRSRSSRRSGLYFLNAPHINNRPLLENQSIICQIKTEPRTVELDDSGSPHKNHLASAR